MVTLMIKEIVTNKAIRNKITKVKVVDISFRKCIIKTIAAKENNKDWHAGYPFFKMYNRDIVKKHLNIYTLKISNILKTKLERQILKDDKTVIERLFTV